MEPVLKEFSKIAIVSVSFQTSNREDTAETKIAIIGFQRFTSVENWTYQHWQIIDGRVTGELSDAALSDDEDCRQNFRMFACLCIGALLGTYVAEELSDDGFLYGDMLLLGFMTMNYADICSASMPTS